MTERIVGIDLGTTNSVVAVADGQRVHVLLSEDGRALIPSVVSFPPEGRPLVGVAARARKLVDPRNTVYSVKRLIGRPYRSPEVERAKRRFAFELVERKGGGVGVRIRNEVYTLSEISSMVLRELRRIAERALGETVRRAVVTVPANFNELQRSATRAAAHVTGLRVERILNEPTAAALAYGQRREMRRVVVYDLGGGTFDVTLLEMEADVYEVLATAGDTFLGGDDIDLRVAECMADRLAESHGRDAREHPKTFERLRAAAEWLKCALSSQPHAEVRIEEPFDDPDERPFVFSLSRPQLEELARPLLQRSLELCESLLREVGMKPSDFDGVVLVGGSTKMPLVRQMVEQFFGRPAERGIDPDLVVAQGAAIHAYALAGRPKAPVRIVAPELAASTAAAGSPRGPQRPAAPRAPAALLPSAAVSAEHSENAAASASEALQPSGPAERASAERTADAAAPRRAPEPAAAAEDTVVIDPAYLQEVEAVAPGGIQRYADRGEGNVEIEIEYETEIEAEQEDGSVPQAGGAARPAASTDAGAPAPEAEAEEAEEARELAAEPSRPLSVPADALAPPVLFGLPEPAPSPSAAGSPAESEENIEELPSELLQSLPPSAPPPASGSPAAALAVGSLVLPMSDKPPPLLMDVTPHALGVETAGGYCQHVIERGTPVPTEQRRIFTTARDGQQAVTVRICQGPHRRFDANQYLGELTLEGLRQAPRGQVRIEVTFMLDASGTLDVKARDLDTGRAQSTRIALQGELEPEDIEAMRQRHEALFGQEEEAWTPETQPDRPGGPA